MIDLFCFLNNGLFSLEPLSEALDERWGDKTQILIHRGIYDLFSDAKVTAFNQILAVKNYQDVYNQLTNTINGYQHETVIEHYLFDLKLERLIGKVSVISPKTVIDSHDIIRYYTGTDNNTTCLIEYYLNKSYWGKGIMRGIVGAVTRQLFNNGISTVGAFCHTANSNSNSVLIKNGFVIIPLYKDFQGQQLWVKQKNN